MYTPPLFKIYPHVSLGEYVRKEWILVKDKFHLRFRDVKTGVFISHRKYNLMRGVVGYHNKLRALRRAKPELTYSEARNRLKELKIMLEKGIIDKEELSREMSP